MLGGALATAQDKFKALLAEDFASAVLHHSPVPVVVLHPPHKSREDS